MMDSTSPRVYVVAQDHEGKESFLHTFLSNSDAVDYITDHHKAFSGRFRVYRYGMAHVSKDRWTEVYFGAIKS